MAAQMAVGRLRTWRNPTGRALHLNSVDKSDATIGAPTYIGGQESTALCATVPTGGVRRRNLSLLRFVSLSAVQLHASNPYQSAPTFHGSPAGRLWWEQFGL